MNRIDVESTCVASIGWDPQTGTLEVEYVGGRVYQYGPVPEFVWIAFRDAPSKGQFVNSVVKSMFPVIG